MARFPKGLAHLVPVEITGQIVGLTVRPKRRQPVVPVDAWELGSKQDHGTSKSRAVTLISAAHVQAIAATLGREEVDWTIMRRNVLVAGINVNTLRGRTFAVGDEVLLKGTKPCDPCSRMPKLLGDGAYGAMLGLGGVCASIVRGGTIRMGDTIRLLPVESEDAEQG